MIVHLNSKYDLRPLSLKYLKGIYKSIWSKSYITRPMGYNAYVSFVQAVVRFIEISLDKCDHYFVIVDSYDNVVGMFRYTYHNSFVTIGYGICTEARGLGLIDDCLRYVKYWVDKPIYAIVQNSNIYSKSVLERNGFKLNNFDLKDSKCSYIWKSEI